jgi:hypothetical protein
MSHVVDHFVAWQATKKPVTPAASNLKENATSMFQFMVKLAFQLAF